MGCRSGREAPAFGGWHWPKASWIKWKCYRSLWKHLSGSRCYPLSVEINWGQGRSLIYRKVADCDFSLSADLVSEQIRFMLLSDNFANKPMTQSPQQMGFFSWGRNYCFCPKKKLLFFLSRKLISGKCDDFSFPSETQLFQITPSDAYGLLSNMQKFSLEKSNLWHLVCHMLGKRFFKINSCS